MRPHRVLARDITGQTPYCLIRDRGPISNETGCSNPEELLKPRLALAFLGVIGGKGGEATEYHLDCGMLSILSWNLN
jgi:hypothetical protein